MKIYLNKAEIKKAKPKPNLFLPSHGKLQDVECGNSCCSDSLLKLFGLLFIFIIM